VEEADESEYWLEVRCKIVKKDKKLERFLIEVNEIAK